MSKSRPPQAGVTRKHLARAEREALLTQWVTGITIAIVVIVAGLLAYGWLDQNVLQLRRPVAKVGEVEISTERFQKAVKYQRMQIIEQYFNVLNYAQLAQAFGSDAQTIQYYEQQAGQLSAQLEQSDTIGRQALDDLIDEEIVRQEARQRNFTIPPDEVQKALEEAFGFYQNGTPTARPTQTAVPTEPPTATPTGAPTGTPTATVAPTEMPTAGPSLTPNPTATPYTQEGFDKRKSEFFADMVKNTDFTEDDFRRLVEYTLLRKELQESFEVETTIKTARARHILIKIEDENNPESVAKADALAKDLIKQLQEGADFGELAKQFSADDSNKDKGGDLGTADDGAYVPEFNEVAFNGPLGLYATPVKTTFGFHVIEVIEQGTRALSEDEIAQKQADQFEMWLSEQRANPDFIVEYDWEPLVPTHPTFEDVINNRPTSTPAPTDTGAPPATATP